MIQKSHLVAKSNLLFLLLEKDKKSTILGFSFPSVYNCDSCPMCTGDLKENCLICGTVGETWINGKC